MTLTPASFVVRFTLVNIARRLCCIALQAALLTMTIVSGGYACDSRVSTEAEMHEMAGMQGHGPAERERDAPPRPGCPSPTAPRDCSAMVSCLPIGIGAAASTAGLSPSLLRDRPYTVVNELRSVTRSPEPPPPKA